MKSIHIKVLLSVISILFGLIINIVYINFVFNVTDFLILLIPSIIYICMIFMVFAFGVQTNYGKTIMDIGCVYPLSVISFLMGLFNLITIYKNEQVHTILLYFQNANLNFVVVSAIVLINFVVSVIASYKLGEKCHKDKFSNPNLIKICIRMSILAGTTILLFYPSAVFFVSRNMFLSVILTAAILLFAIISSIAPNASTDKSNRFPILLFGTLFSFFLALSTVYEVQWLSSPIILGFSVLALLTVIGVVPVFVLLHLFFNCEEITFQSTVSVKDEKEIDRIIEKARRG